MFNIDITYYFNKIVKLNDHIGKHKRRLKCIVFELSIVS